jgi:hypothetical protein
MHHVRELDSIPDEEDGHVIAARKTKRTAREEKGMRG